jgi:hypothetical protein
MAQILLVQGREHFSPVIYPLPDNVPVPPTHEHRGALEEEVVDLGPPLSPDLHHVSEPFCGHEGGPGEHQIDLTE